jgi:hypothetical protein
MVGHAENLLGAQAPDAAFTQAVEGLGRSDFVAVETVDVKLYGAVFNLLNHMFVPDLVKESVHIRFR